MNLRDMCIPIEQCYTIRAGNIQPVSVNELKERYDQAPVLDGEKVIGIIRTETLEDLYKKGLPLTGDSETIDRTTICSEATVGQLLDTLSERKAVIVISSNKEPLGLIHVADLNKPPLRFFLYSVLFELESRLANLIIELYDDPWDWLVHLSQNQQVQIVGYWEIAKRLDIDLDVGPIYACTLTDLISVVRKDGKLYGTLGFSSTKQVEKVLKRIPELRNIVMHPVRHLISNIHDVDSLKKNLASIDEILSRLVKV